MSDDCETSIHTCFKKRIMPCNKLKTELLALVSRGIPFVRACEIYLVDPLTFVRWRDLSAEGHEELLEFSQNIMKSETEFELELIGIASKNSTAASKLLENRFPQRWASYAESDIEKMSSTELQEFIMKNEKKLLKGK